MENEKKINLKLKKNDIVLIIIIVVIAVATCAAMIFFTVRYIKKERKDGE